MMRWRIGETEQRESITKKYSKINWINIKNKRRSIGKKKILKTRLIERESNKNSFKKTKKERNSNKEINKSFLKGFNNSKSKSKPESRRIITERCKKQTSIGRN